MLYAIILIDQPGSAEVRHRERPAHKAYLQAVADHIAFAGTFTTDDGRLMTGSLLVIDFVSREAVQAWLADEPFTLAGLYASTDVRAFTNLWPQRAGFPPAA